MKLTFYGGAGTVTGANYLIETSSKKILIDCGLFQGCDFCDDINHKKFPYNASDIDYVLVTHAHIDHTGRIPKLYKEGFRGKILATKPTIDLSRVILEDGIGIMGEQAEFTHRDPLYIEKDLSRTLSLFQGVEYGDEIDLGNGAGCVFRDAGHILGSAVIEVYVDGKKLVFTGDLGNPPTPLLRPTEFIDEAQYIIIESAYGDRIHEAREDRKSKLEDVIENTARKKGVLMIPAFAIERTQEILYELNSLVENKRIPQMPVFIDSPMAIKAIDIYKKYPQYYNKEAKYLIDSGDNLFKFPGLKLTRTVEESKAINDYPPPKIIIAGSGMSQGGRILHHEKRYLRDSKNTILFIGYQVAKTTGRRIFDGEKFVEILGKRVSVKATTKAIGGYSAHADQKQLLKWVDNFKRPVKKIFVVQGEEEPSKALMLAIRDRLGIDASAPKGGESVDI